MTIEQIAKLSPLVLGWVTATIGWCTALVQWRKKRKSEGELKLIRRRGEAPFLIPSGEHFDSLFLDGSENEAHTANSNTVLSVFRCEINRDVPAGTLIRLVVENHGKAARRLSASLDGEPVQLREEPKLKFVRGLTFLEYPYRPQKHGNDQKLQLSFETVSGIQHTHAYTLKHGFRSLTRTDPS